MFPAHSGFAPGWVYVHVCGGAACLISPILGTCVVGVCCVLHCTCSPHSQNTMPLCWECTLWFSGTALLLLLCSVSQQCVTVFFYALLFFTVRCLSHYSSSFLFICNQYLRYVHVVAFFTRSVLLSQMYITTVWVSFCLAGKVVVVLSWGRSVFATRLAGCWLGLGGMGFYG